MEIDKSTIEVIKKFLSILYPHDLEQVAEELELFISNRIDAETVKEFKESIKEQLVFNKHVKTNYVDKAVEKIFNDLSNPIEPRIDSVLVIGDTVYLYDVDDWTSVVQREVEFLIDEDWLE